MKTMLVSDDTTATQTPIAQLIRQRRTIRRFEKGHISADQVQQWLQLAAASLHTSYEQLTCRFLIAASEAGKHKAASLILDAYTQQGIYKLMPRKLYEVMHERTRHIPCILFAIVQSDPNPEQHDRNVARISALVHQFSLIAWDNRIGMVWGTGHMLGHPTLVQGLQLEANEHIHCMLYMGEYNNIPKVKPRTPARNKLTMRL